MAHDAQISITTVGFSRYLPSDKKELGPMTMRTGQLWECRNGACRCEILVVAKSGAKSRVEPRCCCGSMMQKAYARTAPNARSGNYRGTLQGNGAASRLHRPLTGALSKNSPRTFLPK